MSIYSNFILLFHFYLFLKTDCPQSLSPRSSNPLSFTTIYQHITPLPQRLSSHSSIHFPVLRFHHSPTLRNIVLDCLADAIILGLYLHNHISHLHSWVLTEARQVKHHTRGGKTMEAHLELRPGLSSAPCHYPKHCWPFYHLANASMSPSPSLLPTVSHFILLVFFNLLYLSLDSCTVISSFFQTRSIRGPQALSISSSLSLTHYNFFCP